MLSCWKWHGLHVAWSLSSKATSISYKYFGDHFSFSQSRTKTKLHIVRGSQLFISSSIDCRLVASSRILMDAFPTWKATLKRNTKVWIRFGSSGECFSSQLCFGFCQLWNMNPNEANVRQETSPSWDFVNSLKSSFYLNKLLCQTLLFVFTPQPSLGFIRSLGLLALESEPRILNFEQTGKHVFERIYVGGIWSKLLSASQAKALKYRFRGHLSKTTTTIHSQRFVLNSSWIRKT